MYPRRIEISQRGIRSPQGSVISVNSAGLRETIAGLIDKISFPQPAKGLVAGHVGIIIEVRKNFPKIFGALGI